MQTRHVRRSMPRPAAHSMHLCSSNWLAPLHNNITQIHMLSQIFTHTHTHRHRSFDQTAAPTNSSRHPACTHLRARLSRNVYICVTQTATDPTTRTAAPHSFPNAMLAREPLYLHVPSLQPRLSPIPPPSQHVRTKEVLFLPCLHPICIMFANLPQQHMRSVFLSRDADCAYQRRERAFGVHP